MAAAQEQPILSLATTGARLAGPDTLLQAAQLAGLRQLDVELAGRMRGFQASTLVRAAADRGIAVRAIWLPQVSAGRTWIDRSASLAELAGELAAGSGARSLVLDRPHGPPPSRAHQARLLRAVRDKVQRGARLTFAIRPGELEGTREHLRALAALRRAAEEWDIDLALDLHGPIDPTWESEAAVSKVLPRLTVVRIGPIQSRPPGRGRAHQTTRVLAFLADLGYRGTIAIVSEAPFWRPDRAVIMARSCHEAAATILARYDALRQELRFDAPTQGLDRP